MQRKHIFIGQVAGLFKTVYRWHKRTRTGCNKEAAPVNLPLIDTHVMRIDKFRMAEQHLAAVGTKAFRIIMRLDLIDDRLHVFIDLAEVHLGSHRLQAELTGAAHQRCDFGRVYQCLAGHTSGVQAVTAELFLFFYQGYFQSQLRCDTGDHQPACTATDNDQISLVHQPSPACCDCNSTRCLNTSKCVGSVLL